MNSGRLAVRAIAKNVVPRRNYGGGHHHRAATMNDLPIPQGDFFMQNAAQQRKHNTVLAIGVAMFTATLYMSYQTKIIHLNFSPPDTYE